MPLCSSPRAAGLFVFLSLFINFLLLLLSSGFNKMRLLFSSFLRLLLSSLKSVGCLQIFFVGGLLILLAALSSLVSFKASLILSQILQLRHAWLNMIIFTNDITFKHCYIHWNSTKRRISFSVCNLCARHTGWSWELLKKESKKEGQNAKV